VHGQVDLVPQVDDAFDLAGGAQVMQDDVLDLQRFRQRRAQRLAAVGLRGVPVGPVKADGCVHETHSLAAVVAGP